MWEVHHEEAGLLFSGDSLAAAVDHVNEEFPLFGVHAEFHCEIRADIWIKPPTGGVIRVNCFAEAE